MSNTPEAASYRNSTKLLIFLPLRAIYFYSLCYETPCNSFFEHSWWGLKRQTKSFVPASQSSEKSGDSVKKREIWLQFSNCHLKKLIFNLLHTQIGFNIPFKYYVNPCRGGGGVAKQILIRLTDSQFLTLRRSETSFQNSNTFS